MADFFSRLAERTLGTAPVIRPNLPSVFSPVPALDVSAEFVSAPPAHAPGYALAQNDRRDGIGGPAISSRSSRSLRPEQKSMETSFRQPMVFPPAVEPVPDATEWSPEEFESTAASANSESPRQRNFDRDTNNDHTISALERESHDAIAERIVTQPARAVFSSSESFAPERSQSTSTVQVSIGRVEVRAVMPAAATPRRVERSTPPLLSLDQYLRERNEGKR